MAEKNKEKTLNPYVGARPFTRSLDDRRRFYGRDDETDEIVSLILSHRLVLIYGPSGAGKTSIFEAQVAPTLEQHGFDVLPRARAGIASDEKSKFTTTYDASSKLINFYMLNVFQSLAPEVSLDLVYDKSLFEFLNIHFPFDHNGNGKPQVLVIDQLEELFTYYPGDTWREQQKKFFEQIANVLEKNIELQIVFIIREENLAQLDQFVHILPGRLRPRFRLGRLTKDAAFLAIKNPLVELDISSRNHTSLELDNRIKEKIVKNLAKVRTENPLSDKRTNEPTLVEGEFIEPIHLQIVCERRWKQLLSFGETENNQSHLGSLIDADKPKWLRLKKWFRLKSQRDNKDESRAGKESAYLVDVDTALREFYEEEIHNVITNSNVSEGAIRRLFQEKFITSSGTRAFVHEREVIQGLIRSRRTRAFLHWPAFVRKGGNPLDR